MHNFRGCRWRVVGRPPRAKRLPAAAIIICLAGATLLWGCRDKMTSAAVGPPTTLRIGVALLGRGIPSMGVPAFVNSLTTESLMAIDWDGRPARRLVSHWETLHDARSVRLRLDPKVTFHDGSPVTAEIVRERLNSVIANSDSPPPLSFRSIVDIRVVDLLTVDLILQRPEAFLLTDLVDVRVPHPKIPAAGTGAYRLLEMSAAKPGERGGDHARLEAFAQYHRAKPQTDFIEVKGYSTQRHAWAALMRGEIDALHEVSPNAIDFVEAESSVETYAFLRGYYGLLGFNQRHPILKNREVRQALSHAVNREQIVKQVFRGRGQAAAGPVWPFHWAYSTGQKTYTYNPELARVRLDAAGFTLPRVASPSRMPSRFGFTCLIWANDARYESMALILQKQLFDIGVDMEVEAVPFEQFLERMATGAFDALLMEYTSGRSVGYIYNAWHSSQPNRYSPNTGYQGADRVLDRLRNATTQQEIRAAVGELQRTLYEDPPALFIAWPETSRAVSTAFEVPRDASPDVLGNIWRWRPRTEVARR